MFKLVLKAHKLINYFQAFDAMLKSLILDAEKEEANTNNEKLLVLYKQIVDHLKKAVGS